MICDDFITEARRSASAWARNLLSIPAQHWIILDTETTGLDENAEVIQIGVTDGAGKVLMDNTPCKPLRQIPAEATAIHHITNEMVQNAAPFQSAWDTLTRIADGKIVVVFNAAYDRRLLLQSASACLCLSRSFQFAGSAPCSSMPNGLASGTIIAVRSAGRNSRAAIIPPSATVLQHWRRSGRWLKVVSKF